MKAQDLMTTAVVTVGVDTPFKEVALAMLEADVSGLPVIDTDGSVVGIVTEADLVAKETGSGPRRRLLGVIVELLGGLDTTWQKKSEGLCAGDLMSSPPVTASPHDDVQSIARRMLTQRVKRLPVVDTDGQLVGIVSRADLIALFNRTDRQLTADVRRVLHDPMVVRPEHDITGRARKGVVTLTGSVRGAAEREALVAAVAAVPGVIDVTSHLEERQPPANDSEGLLDRLRHTGVGVEDPNIISHAGPADRT